MPAEDQWFSGKRDFFECWKEKRNIKACIKDWYYR